MSDKKKVFRNQPSTKIRPLNDDRDPWVRQRYESAKAFEAFSIYRDMGVSRSLHNVAQVLSKSDTIMKRWSVQWRWVERAAEWDVECDRVSRNEQLEAVAEMGRRHATQAQLAIGALGQLTGEFLKRVQRAAKEGDKKFLDGLSNDDLMKYLIQGMGRLEMLTKVERTARGLPDAWLMIGEMTDEQLQEFTASLLSERTTGDVSDSDFGDEEEGASDTLARLALGGGTASKDMEA
jgi:hypothetical protein